MSLLPSSGCKKSQPGRLTPAKIHSITRELANAAHSAAPAGTQIQIGLQASEKNPGTSDSLDITLAKTATDSAAKSDAAKIQRALTTVATRHGLTEEISAGTEGASFFYLKSGVRTHAIQIHTGVVTAQQNQGGASSQNGAKLAIILDDLGNDPRSADDIFNLPYPLTISVLPNHEHSQEIAQEAERRGYQVLLHLPMQAVATEKPEAQELRPGMPAAEVSKMVNQFIQGIPGAVGVNNHQGSEATSDPTLMRELMPVLRDHHLFYIDSRTTAATVAYETAQSSRVPSAFRNVPFLDDVTEVGAVRKQLELALRGAREKGEAVAIGHPHPATLEALREVLPTAQSEGVRLAFASELVH
ncbi:MAG TPA: divergent polysaccharide deacetylase family protein [Candidatus Acidoferrum sp.]|nr:divergent polysaccharide deacetylase family protein [Candidatus Acidoferrum sp.]